MLQWEKDGGKEKIKKYLNKIFTLSGKKDKKKN